MNERRGSGRRLHGGAPGFPAALSAEIRRPRHCPARNSDTIRRIGPVGEGVGGDGSEYKVLVVRG